MAFACIGGVIRNCWCARKLSVFPFATKQQFVVGPFRIEDLAAVVDLYASLNNGQPPGIFMTTVLRLLGPRLCMVARHGDRMEVIGVAIYYFNARDRIERTVHEGYIGLRESARNAGLGTFMRRHALEHFAREDLSGVSSRISAGNVPSLRSNEKLGFVCVETYFDPERRERRHYLVCDLDLYRNKG